MRQLVFLSSTTRDLAWYRRYYSQVFPQGRRNAGREFKKAYGLLASEPFMGVALNEFKDVREFSIPRTPFSIIYRVTDTQVQVLRLWDQRQGSDKPRFA